MVSRRVLAFAASLLSLPAGGSSQENPQRPETTIKVETVLVTLTATVSDARDRYVSLAKQDFSIFEDGVRQEITSFPSDDQTSRASASFSTQDLSRIPMVGAVTFSKDPIMRAEWIKSMKPSWKLPASRGSSTALVITPRTAQKSERTGGSKSESRTRATARGREAGTGPENPDRSIDLDSPWG